MVKLSERMLIVYRQGFMVMVWHYGGIRTYDAVGSLYMPDAFSK